jgi:hypothetical protein
MKNAAQVKNENHKTKVMNSGGQPEDLRLHSHTKTQTKLQSKIQFMDLSKRKKKTYTREQEQEIESKRREVRETGTALIIYQAYYTSPYCP